MERTIFWGAEVTRLRSVGRATAPMPDPANVFGAASRGRLAWNVAGAADAKESTAIRETRQLKEEIFRIPERAY